MNKERFYIIFLLYFIPVSAWANIGMPMVFVTTPLMLANLLPVILIEFYVIKRHLGLTSKKAIASSIIANGVSTIIGIPLTWGILVFLQMMTGGGKAYGLQTIFQKFLAVTWQAPWLVPYGSNLDWMMPIALLVLLIPFFFVSWKIEYLLVGGLNRKTDRQSVNAACLRANAITYGLLALYPFGMLVFSPLFRES